MGVDTKAIIRKGTTIKEIVKVLEQKYNNIKVMPTSVEYYFNITFADGKDNRMLSVFVNDCGLIDYNIDGILLSLGYWDGVKSKDIMLHLLRVFGGYLDENDCDEEGFYPVNIKAFEKSKLITAKDRFTNKVISIVGYDKAEIVLALCEEFKSIDN